jgi:hypothetical protein
MSSFERKKEIQKRQAFIKKMVPGDSSVITLHYHVLLDSECLLKEVQSALRIK